MSSLAISLPENERNIQMDECDVSTLLKALEMAAKSPDTAGEAFGYRYSTLELLCILSYLSYSPIILQKIAKPSLIAPLQVIIRRGQIREMVASLRVLWNILEVPQVKEVIQSSHKVVVEHLIEKCAKVENEELCLWSKGVTAVLQPPAQTDGMFSVRCNGYC